MDHLDSQFASLRYVPSEIAHRYGPNVHILSDPYCLTLLARLCSPDTRQPWAGRLVRQLYEYLLHAVVNAEFPRREISMATRMRELEPRAIWTGPVVDSSVPVAVLALARAGLQPSQICFEALSEFMDPGVVRQDHVAAQRSTGEGGQITGTVIAAAKIGGSLEDAIVVVPDPMGATGSTILALLDHFRSHGLGTPRKMLLLHLMVTPEYLRRFASLEPWLSVYSLRLDRGLSAPRVLACPPGERWEEERGLTDKGYIVPGAGGVGELLNNSWV
ncbi:MAG: uracil phosphoribosyltransferase [Polyangia bacterium]|jgi:uracil phosphoribosyltransferase|nr:uracil phosphoribosyltransferase [Polyangia bacterium]